MLRQLFKFIMYVLLIIFSSANIYSQHPVAPTTITGIVRDSVSLEPIPYAAIFFKGSDKGLLANENGEFNMTTSTNFISLSVTTMGYKEKEVFVNKGKTNELEIKLVPTGVALKEVVVNYKKDKYSKKNNPAVIFMEKLRNRRKLYDPKNHDYYSFDKHTKINLGLNNFSEEQKKNWIMKKFSFIFDYLDTSEVSGKPILNVSVKEKISTEYFRKKPHNEKELVRGNKSAGIDEVFDQESIQRFLEDVFREVNIFENDITIMQNRFVSPLSSIGENFYKYYLTDTIPIDGVNCIELSFVPFTPESFGFTGRIYVPVEDTTLFIKRVKLNVPKSINLNYVENIYMTQDFEKAPDGSRLKIKDDMTVEFQIMPSTQGLYARRLTKYRNHSFECPQNLEIFNQEGKTILAENALYMPEQFWNDNRQIPIKESENSISKMLVRLREVPAFYWTEKVIVTLISGYIPTKEKNSKFDFGPMNTTISGNPVEGMRLRVGGMTTAHLSKNLFSRGYLAYGLKDKKMKYQAELEYSFNDKKYHSMEFPIHSIKASHSYDVDQIGQHYFFTNADNVFLAIKRQSNDKMTYLRSSNLQYKLETQSGFSVTAGFKYDTQEATKWLPFVDGYGNIYKKYHEASFNLTLRYAPGEKFYQTKNYRIPINLDAPVFTLTQTFAPKGLMSSLSTINKTELSIQKRFWFSAFGYTDIILKAGKIWSEVNYPNLLIPNANLSYTIQPESYTLMNALEFANDQYLSWDLTYWANGAIFNRIPMLKYLKLREVFSFRGLYGKLSDQNNPAYNSALFRFPTNTNCIPMEKKPYLELGVGLDNIFTILRLDYVWRLTYKDVPGIDKSGLRIQLHFTF